MERDSVVARDFLGLSGGNNLSGGSNVSECNSSTTVAQVQAQSQAQPREEMKPYLKDNGVCLANISLQWPYSSKAAALEQFISFKQEGSKKSSFDQLNNSGFRPITTADAFELINKNAPGMQSLNHDPTARNTIESGNYYSGHNGALNRNFGLSHITYSAHPFDEQGSSGYNMQKVGTFPSSNHSYSVSNLGSPAYIKGEQTAGTTTLVRQFQGMPLAGQHSFLPVVGASTRTTIPGAVASVSEKPAGEQLTIFYSGSVNVYDDVPADKAQAIMFLAGNGNFWSGKTATTPCQSPAMSMSVATNVHARQGTPIGPRLSNASCPTNPQGHSQNSQATVQTSQPTPAMSSAGDSQTNRNNGASTNLQETPKVNAAMSTPAPIMPREVPQARKASLARFLEKRKERVCTKAPYQTKKPSEDSSHGEIPLSPSHSSTPPVDGCKQLHNEFMTRSEEKVSCLVKDQHEQLWPVKVEKNEIKERQLQLT